MPKKKTLGHGKDKGNCYCQVRAKGLGFQVKVRVMVYLATSADTVSFHTLATSPQIRSLHNAVFDLR